MSKYKNVSIILVNYNGYKDTIACLKSLEKIIYCHFNIIIVDNDSDNNEYEKLMDATSNLSLKIDLLKSDSNLGFAGANNLAIRYCLETNIISDYFLLLNNDTLVETNFIDELIKTAESDNEIGLVGSKIMYYPEREKIWYAGGMINWNKYTSIHYGDKQIDNGKYNEICEIDFITGCVMLIKLEVIKEVGLLPEDYFMYYEDFDYCVQVKDAGFKLYYTPKSIVYHKVSSSTGGEESAFSLQYGTRNRRMVMKKYRYKNPMRKLIFSYTYFYLTRIIKIIKYLFKLDNQKAMAIIKGLTMNIA